MEYLGLQRPALRLVGVVKGAAGGGAVAALPAEAHVVVPGGVGVQAVALVAGGAVGGAVRWGCGTQRRVTLWRFHCACCVSLQCKMWGWGCGQ